MPGPLPKDPSVRARRNKTSTAAKLPLDGPGVEAPYLPPRIVEVDGEQREAGWHPLALQLWEDVWASPMVPEFLTADVHGLYVLVALTDAYWRRMEAGQVSGAAELSKEIRQQRMAYGLTPIDRRRLQWEVEKAEDASDKGRRRRRTTREQEAAADAGNGIDPRALLGG